MKQVNMTFPNYPMLGYFLNMFNASQPPSFTLSFNGPTTTEIPISISFYADPDTIAIEKMCAAADGKNFTAYAADPVMPSQFPEISVDGTAG